MTLREVGEKFSNSFNDTKNWLLDGADKLTSGNILDLTIGQTGQFDH